MERHTPIECQRRRRLPSRLSAATFQTGFDVVIPCLLEGDGMVDAINCTAFAGKVVMYGCIGICNTPVDFLKSIGRESIFIPQNQSAISICVGSMRKACG